VGARRSRYEYPRLKGKTISHDERGRVMTRIQASLMGAAALALGVFSHSNPAAAQRWVYPPERVDWMVAPGAFGFSGFPWPGPPIGSPVLRPTLGCYFTRARIENAWREVEVCS
jgi:hypothetical protein